MIPADFFPLILPGAQETQTSAKIPASFTLAQAALESGWGSSQLFTNARNIFGIKVYPGWTGDVYKLQTHEFQGDKVIMVPADWCLYGTYAECIADHARFLTTEPRYAACFSHPYSGAEFAIEVQKAGYSTDPDYAEKISSIIRFYRLTQYDNAAS